MTRFQKITKTMIDIFWQYTLPRIKMGCAAANPRLLRGQLLCYGRVGLLNPNIYLRCKINVILAKGNTVVALRKIPDAMTLLPNVEISQLLKYFYKNKDTEIELCVTVAVTRTKRQKRIIIMTNEVGFKWDMRKDMCVARDHRCESERHAAIVSLFRILDNILESTVIMSDKGTMKVKNTYISCLLACGSYNHVKIV